ncbi:MAG: DUF4012 domain-containing protein [Chloroflexi bacterium]|nr:DUF4012 domain-containing protein [Chloroflexota bacterium]MBP8059667.1 DUF4012 domain-containing protein [Chloroflexota bacterium]
MSNTTRNRLPVYILLAGILLLLLWSGLKVVRIVQVAQSLQAKQSQVEALLAGGLGQINPDEAEALVLELRADIVTLKRETAIFMPLRGLLSGVDKIGPTLAVAPQLLEIADAGTEAAVYLVQGLKPGLIILNNPGQGGSPLPQLVEVIDQARPQLIQATTGLDRVAAARAQITSTTTLPWRVQELLRQLDTYLPLAQNGLQVMQVLPAIMGQTGPRTYLIAAQNEDELRATGGFISGVGILRLDRGQIISLDFVDAYNIDDWASKPYDFPPQPIYTFMGLELFLFRDANFWPDFPTSAENMMNLYTYGQELPLDGVIAVDQQFVALMVGATGPVPLPQYNLTVTGDNAVTSMRQAWEGTEDQGDAEWLYTRKDFIGQLASALRTRLEGNPGEINWPIFLQAVDAAIQGKHLQIYVRDPVVASVLNEVNFDGRVESVTGQDFLYVVDTNMGYNKATALINTSLNYAVILEKAGGGTAELTITHQHTGQSNSPPPCVQGVGGYTADKTYDQLIHRCYWSYLRVYTPVGSELLAASSHPAPAEAFSNHQPWNGLASVTEDNSGFPIWENFVLVPYGQMAQVLFNYRLPATITPTQADGHTQYQLQVSKQAGTLARPLTLTITLPDGSQLLQANPAPQTIEGQNLIYSLELRQDLTLTVDYQ